MPRSICELSGFTKKAEVSWCHMAGIVRDVAESRLIVVELSENVSPLPET